MDHHENYDAYYKYGSFDAAVCDLPPTPDDNDAPPEKEKQPAAAPTPDDNDAPPEKEKQPAAAPTPDDNDAPPEKEKQPAAESEKEKQPAAESEKEKQPAAAPESEKESAADGSGYEKFEELYPADDADIPLAEACDPLDVFSGTQLADATLPPVQFVVDTLLSNGLGILSGAPKVGKSWLVLNLCIQVAKGEPFWGMPTKQGKVLYITLEDSENRLQRRMLSISEQASDNLYFALNCSPLSSDLEKQITRFCIEHLPTRLVVIDTFQRVRAQSKDLSYSNDYGDGSQLKALADNLGICILLVHHNRKMGDSDKFNLISGTNGLSGSADTLMVMEKEKRNQREVNLSCTGRDIEDRELTLEFDKEAFRWLIKSDSYTEPQIELPEEIRQVIAFVKEKGFYAGFNSEFVQALSAYTGVKSYDMRTLKYRMNRYHDILADNGIGFESLRTNKGRRIMLSYDEQNDKTHAAGQCHA